MVNYIFANPGQTVRLVVATLDGYDGYLGDGYIPVVTNVYFPDLSIAVGYPKQMTRMDTGIYALALQIPKGSSALGTYVASVFWMEGAVPRNEVFALNVAMPFGNTSVTPI